MDHCPWLFGFSWFSSLFQAKKVRSQLHALITSLSSIHRDPQKGTHLHLNWGWVNFNLKQSTSFCLTSAQHIHTGISIRESVKPIRIYWIQVSFYLAIKPSAYSEASPCHFSSCAFIAHIIFCIGACLTFVFVQYYTQTQATSFLVSHICTQSTQNLGRHAPKTFIQITTQGMISLHFYFGCFTSEIICFIFLHLPDTANNCISVNTTQKQSSYTFNSLLCLLFPHICSMAKGFICRYKGKFLPSKDKMNTMCCNAAQALVVHLHGCTINREGMGKWLRAWCSFLIILQIEYYLFRMYNE